MTVSVKVDIDKNQFIVTATKDGFKLFKSPMKGRPKTKIAIEKQLRKDLKAYDTPLYGGMNIFFTKQTYIFRRAIMSKLEYLNPEDWSLHVIDGESEAVPEGWVLVPEGGEKFAICNGFQSFWKNDAVLFLGIDNDWDYGYMSFNDYCEANNNDPEILWQRESKSEVVELKGVDSTLAERQAQYGSYEDVSFVTENIISVLKRCNYDEMPNPHKMAMYMIASKMARLVSGDCNHLDSWHDIGGYSKLIENLIEGK